MIELVVATKNRKKFEEIKEILRDLDLKMTYLKNYSKTPKIIEDGRTFKDNAIKKALKVSRFTGQLVLGEDSGLCVDALGGRPGIFSSRFSGKDKSDRKNNLKLLSELKGLSLKKRRAEYVCVVALADGERIIATAEGKCSGLISFEMKGDSGFGYDPLFIIPKYKRTFAQLGPKIKHRISHRYRALKKIKKIIQKYIEQKKINWYNLV